ncbi:ThuA domain-containing protein [Actomonas aquatica]|uniref:ThuA domain-containing protein n=1 Tax=Actomonas aquatica TaxID=2866162 RepID=A0ABZ1CHT2_9BACT|nr:ThuA domain-containing protein [Opitutus sp. WL0086]WRQ89820.1 ThuA domain-containing protein [Opitutus sp. WL0086]
MADPLRVTIWNEYRHEKEIPKVAELYPEGIHQTLAELLGAEGDIEVRTATLDEPSHGLTPEVLESTDVMLWWGHCAHDEVDDAIAADVQRRVLEGMGLLVLHSGHYAKPFKRLMGSTCSLKWRENNDKERIWTVMPSHPVAAGVPEHFELVEEMYGEPFGIPEPDETVFISWFSGGEVFRSGASWRRGHGRVFYFRPGHETYPSYHDANVRRVILNAVRWLRPTVRIPDGCPNVEPLE